MKLLAGLRPFRHWNFMFNRPSVAAVMRARGK